MIENLDPTAKNTVEDIKKMANAINEMLHGYNQGLCMNALNLLMVTMLKDPERIIASAARNIVIAATDGIREVNKEENAGKTEEEIRLKGLGLALDVIVHQLLEAGLERGLPLEAVADHLLEGFAEGFSSFGLEINATKETLPNAQKLILPPENIVLLRGSDTEN